MAVQLDQFSVVLLVRRADAPKLDAQAAARLQDAHLANLAALHEAGHLLAAGPMFDEELRGLTIFNVEPDQALALMEGDPAVQAGRFALKAMKWMVPRGALAFSGVQFPRSVSDVGAG